MSSNGSLELIDFLNIKLYLRGKINEQTVSTIEKITPKNKLMIFISSTFTDTKKERNILHEEILPKLQAKAIQEDIFVLFYDMRFGVKDENTANHLTWIACREAIEQCFKESCGMFFLSLQGQKYGYKPLPKYVEKDKFEALMKKYAGEREMRDISREWYFLDNNFLIPQYELKGLRFVQPEHHGFKNAVPLLRDRMFNDFTMETLSNGKELLVNRSITEWETLFALSLDLENCFWIRRPFAQTFLEALNQTSPSKVAEFDDTINNSPQRKKRDNLVKEMENLPPNKIVENNPQWKKVILKQLNAEVDEALSKKRSWRKDILLELGISADYFEEIVHHNTLVRLKSLNFIGSEKLQLAIDSLRTKKKNIQSALDVSMCVVGVSGAGKTSFISKLAMEIQRVTTGLYHIPVIIRFCGTSAYSLYGKDLIESISMQILCIYERKDRLNKFIKDIPTQSYGTAVDYFGSLMLEFPVYLFIDSLDQLSNRDEARKKLSFLKGVKLHDQSRIVVSTLPDEKDPKTNAWKYLYFCEQRLKENDIPRIEIGMIGTEKKQEIQMIQIHMILKEMLQRRGKRLSSDQWRVVLNAAIVEPTMLYLNLSIEVIIKWRSFDQDVILMPTVKDLLHQIFDDLERQYGQQLTRYALGYITYSRDGINDIEMKDCLSMQKEVLKEVFQYDTLHTFPMHVWLRLKRALKNLIVEKENNCVKWYHRQLWETAGERYSSLERQCHEIMGRYFGNRVDEVEKKEKGIHEQPLSLNDAIVWLPRSKINSRRVKEAYYHFLQANMIKEAAEEICSLDFVCASALQRDGYNLISYLGRIYDSTLNHKMEGNECDVDRMRDYFNWIRKEMSAIVKNPRIQVPVTAGAESMKSIVRKDGMAMESILKMKFTVRTENPDNKKTDEIVWCKTLNGKIEKEPVRLNLQAHSEVSSVAWNHDGTRIASVYRDQSSKRNAALWEKTITLWDTTTGEVTNTLEGHTDWVNAVSWNHDGTKIASGSKDKTIMLWNAETGELLNTLGTKIASGSNEQTINNASTEEDQRTSERDSVASVSWKPDGTLIASGSYDGKIKIWDAIIITGEALITAKAHEDWVTSVSWSHNGTRIASGSRDKTIKIWSAEIEGDSMVLKRILTLEEHTDWVNTVSWNPDGTKIASGSKDTAFILWNAKTGELLNTLVGHHYSQCVTSVSWNPNGKMIASASHYKGIKIWNAEDGKELNSFRSHWGFVESIAWNHDGSILASGSRDTTIKTWDISLRESFGHSNWIYSAAWSPDGRRITSGSRDRTIKIWDPVKEQITGTLTGHTDTVCSVTYNHDGSKLASASFDRTIKIWNVSVVEFISGTFNLQGTQVASRSAERTMKGHSSCVTSVSWNPNGTKIASGSDDMTIKIWNAKTGELLNTLEGHSSCVTSVSWNPNGTKIASGSDDMTIKIWNAKTGELLNTVEGHSSCVTSVSWNPDGTKIVSGSDDRTIKIWKGTGGEPLNILEGHTDRVTSVHWNRVDQTKIVSGSSDKTIKIWDAENKQLLNTLEGHSDWVNSVLWNPDGTKIVSASGDKTLVVWFTIKLGSAT